MLFGCIFAIIDPTPCAQVEDARERPATEVLDHFDRDGRIRDRCDRYCLVATHPADDTIRFAPQKARISNRRSRSKVREACCLATARARTRSAQRSSQAAQPREV